MSVMKNFADVIRAKMAAGPVLAEAVRIESSKADVAMKVYDLRKEAGLTQKWLAERIGIHELVISDIEDADYDGDHLAILNRVEKTLDL